MRIILIAVISLDGRITRPGEAGADFASAEDQAWFHRSLREFDCSVMGRKTYSSIREQVLAGASESSAGTPRLRLVMTRHPAAHARDARPGKLEFSHGDVAAIAQSLQARGCRRCALLGGGEIYRQFLNASLVDALWLTLEPLLFGGGTPLVDGAIREAAFELVETRRLSKSTLLLNYTRKGAPGVRLPSP
ncbi:MAG: dihydrofolate reductase family protein [Opitutaceae bacterium]